MSYHFHRYQIQICNPIHRIYWSILQMEWFLSILETAIISNLSLCIHYLVLLLRLQLVRLLLLSLNFLCPLLRPLFLRLQFICLLVLRLQFICLLVLRLNLLSLNLLSLNLLCLRLPQCHPFFYYFYHI